MATTTADITITSTDLLSDSLSLTTSATLTDAGGATGMTQASGLSRKTTTAVTEYTLFAAADYTDDTANKVYLKNTETNTALFFEVQIAGVVVGKLYAGDWAFIPWSADTTGTNCDIDITPSSTASHTLEYMLFHEGL